jgi:hypothetical protein
METIGKPVSVTREIIAFYQEAAVLRLIKRSWKLLMIIGGGLSSWKRRCQLLYNAVLRSTVACNSAS